MAVRVSRYGAIFLTISVSLGVWLLAWLGLLRPADGWLYDHLTRLRPGISAAAERVLLVDTGPAPWRIEPVQWNTAARTLQELGAGAVVFTFSPPLSDAFPDSNELAAGLLVAVPPRAVAQSAPPWPLEADFQQRGIDTAPLAVPRAEAGIHRSADLQLEGRNVLAVAASQRLGAGSYSGSNTSVRVNFSGGRDWIPVVSLQRVLSGGLIPELVRGRVVLLGSVELSGAAGLYTPVHGDVDPVSLTEYQGYLLETLLNHNDVRSPSLPVTLLFLLLVAAVSVVAYQRLSFVMSLRMTLVLVGLYALTGWLFLQFAALWIPLAELVLMQLLLFATLSRHRQLSSEDALQEVLADTRSWVRGHMLPEDFYESSQHWAQIITLVDQSLELERLIFLERVPAEHRVREVKALRCDIDDIDERRRDYERAPYSTAMEQGGPLQLHNAYLKTQTDTEEIQYLVPLIFAGDVVGFWAFGVAPQRLEQRDQFETVVRRFANQIAELLYHRQQWLRDQAAERGALARYLRLEGGASLNRQVTDAIKSAERRRELFDAVLRGLDTALVVYDLFGRVLTVNSAMEVLVQKHDLPVYDMTALDLLTRLTDMTRTQARQVLNHLVLQMQPMHMPVALTGDGKQNHLLVVKPLSGEDAGAAAFDISGLMFELADVSAVSALCSLKESVVEQYVWQMRNDVESIQMGTDLLLSDRPSAQQRARVSEIVGAKLKNLTRFLDRVQKDVRAPAQSISRDGYPLETLSRVQNIIAELETAAAARALRIVLEAPNFISLVIAQPAEFDKLVRNVLETLLNDAAADTEIRVRIRLEPDVVTFELSNAGFGLPDADLQRFLSGTGHAISEEFRLLHECSAALQVWGGEFKASSEVGRGFRFEFSIPAVA